VKTRNRLLCLILVLTMLLGVMPMAGAEDAENALWYTNGPSERREFSGSTTVNKGDTWNFKFYYGTEASSAVVTSGTLASSDSSVVRVTQNAYGDWDAAMAAAGTATLTFTPNNSSGSFTMNVTVTESASGEDTGDDVEPSDLWYAVSDGSGGEDSPVLFTSLTSAVEGSTRSVYLYYGTSDSIGTAERCTTGTFTSSDSSVISVSGPSSDLYTISFLKPGTATLTYTYGGMTFETTVTVKIRVPDASLCDAAPADGPAYLGSEFTFTDNYREFYFAVIAQCPLVINKEAMTINSGAGYVDVEYISGDVNYYKFTVNDNAPTDTSFVLSISCAVYDSLMETDSVFNQSLTLKYSSNDDDAGGNYEGTGSNSDLPEIYDGKALYLDDYVIGFGFDSAVDGSAESNLTINEKTWEYANSTTVAKDEANERYQWRDFTVYAGTKHTDAAGSEYYLEAPANKVTVTVNKMWVELKSGDEGTFSWSDDKSTTVLTKDDFGTDVSAYLYVKNGYVGAGQVWANVTATTNNGNTATGDIAVNIRIERNENLFHTRPANDTTEDLNAFLAELAADYDFTEEITYNITLAATTYEGTIVIPPEFDDTPGISLNLNLSGTSIEGTKVNGGIDLDGSSVSWMSDIIFTANENVTTDAGITSAVYNGKIGHISNCFFRGYDVAVDASEGMINLARDNVLVDNDVAFRIDVADNIGNSRNNWTGNTFIKNSTAIQILSYNDFISPYHFRIWDSNFIGNTKDFYFGADGTVYMYGNYFGNIHNQAQSMGLCEYMEALEQIKTSSAYSSQKLVTTNSPNSDKAGGVKAKLVTSPGRKKVLLDWWKLDSSISDAFDTANTAAYSLLSLSTQTVSDTDTYDNPLVAIWDQETEILNSSASKLLIDASSFETATETDRIITVVDNDGNPIGIWNFGKEAFTGLTGTFNAGLTIDTSVSGQISVTVAESDLLSVLAPTLTIPTDYTDASVIGNDDTGTIDEEGNLSFTVSTAGTYDIESHELWFTVGPGALLMFSDPGTPTVGTSWSPIFAYGAKSEVTTNNEINQSDRLSGTLSVTPADSTVITFGDYDSVIFSAAGTATLNYTTTIDGEERVFSTEITVVDGSGGDSDDTTNSGLYFCTYADSPGGWQEGSQVTFDKNHPPMQVAMGQSVIIHLYLDGTQLDGGTWTVADSTKLSVSETSSGNYTLTGLAFGSTDLTYNDGTTDYTMGVEIGLPILGYYSEQNRSQDTYLTSLDYNSESGNEVWLMNAFGFTEDQMGTLSCEVNRNTSTEISAEKVAWTSDSTKYDIKVTIPGNLTINEFTVRGNNFSWALTVTGGDDGSGGDSDDTTNSGLYFCTYENSPVGWNEGTKITFATDHPPMQVAMGQSVIIHLYLDGTQLDGGTWTVADSTKLSVSETSSGNYTLTGLAFGSTDLTYNDGTTDYTMGVEIGLPILGYYSEQNRSQDTYLTSLDYNSESGNEVWLMNAFGFTEDQMGTLSCEVNRNTSTEISAEKVAWTSDSTKYDIKVTIPGNLTINEFTVRGNNFIWALTVTGGSGSGGSIDGSAAYRTYKKTEYAIGFTWKLSDSETVINEGKFGILQTAIDTDDTGYAFLADVDGIAVGKKETDSEGNDYYIVPTESYDKLPITVTVNKVWVDKDGYLSFSKTEKVTEVASPTFPVTLYAQNESFHALLYAEVDITIDGETATETVSFGLGQRLKVKVDCSDLSDIDVLNAKLQELAANAQDGIGYIITLPEELTGTILIPSNYHGFEFEGADGSTKLNGAININGALVGKLTNVTFFATDVAKTAIYGGACGNVIDCFFYNYDIAIDSTAGLVTVTEGNIFAENVIAVKLDLKDSDNSINRVPWTHNSFIMNDTAIKVVSLHEKFSSFYFRITDSNFIGNETNFDIASGTKVYMYKNFYGKLHSSWDSDTCNVFDYMLALKDVTTETEFHNQKLVIQNNEGKGVGNKVVSNPQWKYPVADWWVDGNKLVGGNSTYSLLNNDAETPYTNVLISDWESETEIINSEANDLTIDASAFAEATDADKVVTVVDNNENLLGTWTFATDVSNGIAVVSNDTDSSAFNAKLTIVEKDEDSFTVTVENSDVLSTYAPTLTVPCAYTGAYVTCDGKEVESAVDTGKRTISFTVAKGGVYTIVKKFNIDGATMTLGNSLAINFFIEPTDLVEGEGYYAVITKEYADGRGNVTVRIDQADWSYHNGYEQHYVTFNGVAAKEMTDELTVTVYNSSGVAVSNEWVDSVRDYTMRMLSKQTDAEKLALYVDMLNYGAAAQTYFDDYNSDDLANSQLTDTQKGYATGEVTMTDSRVQGTGYSASNLTLESDITLNVFFKKDYIDQTKYAVASFTDHYGNEKSVRVEGSAFKQLENDTDWYVPVKGLVVADVRQPVTVTVYNSDGTVSASCTDSIESYVARMSSENALYEAIMKFGVSAYAYFH